jgi:hypothetical protein
LKVIFWGLSSPLFVEAAAAEMHSRLNDVELSVQIPENAQSALYCGVRPEEFLRLPEHSLSELSGVISRAQGAGCVLVLDGWSLIFLPDFLGFLKGVLELTPKLKGLILLGPPAGFGDLADYSAKMTGISVTSQQILFRRALGAVELVLNSKGTVTFIQSAPCLQHVEYLSGRERLGAVERFGIQWCPRLMFREQFQFVSRDRLVSVLAEIIGEFYNGNVQSWRRIVESDVLLQPSRFLSPDIGEWASLARLAQWPLSWEGWCSPSPWPGVRVAEMPKATLRAANVVAWMCAQGAVQKNAALQQREPVERAFLS